MPGPESQGGGAENCRRILLITVDSLRADAPGFCGGQCRTPHMDRLAEESVRYTRAFATGAHTTQSFPGILGSNYPTSGGTVQSFGERVSVAECLRAAGFRTGAIHSNPLLSCRKHYDRGFDSFWDSLPPSDGGAPPAERGSLFRRMGRRMARRLPALVGIVRRVRNRFRRRAIPLEQPHEPAEVITSRAVDWLREVGDSFFLWLHYMDPHWPYGARLRTLGGAERGSALRLSEKALKHPTRLTARELDRLRELYGKEVEYLDDRLGELFTFMREESVWEETAVLLTADHGEAFMEHGTCFHGDLLYDELIYVPLMAKIPGLSPGEEPGVASLIDLAPTLCELAGVEAPDAFEGASLLSARGREAAFAETAYRVFVSETPRRAAVRTADWKLIVDAERREEELYHVASDPAEANDLLGENPKEATRLRKLLDRHQRRTRPRPPRREEKPADQERGTEAVKARLRALGYMDELPGDRGDDTR
jgi:arylsulfatase A-like enzyme